MIKVIFGLLFMVGLGLLVYVLITNRKPERPFSLVSHSSQEEEIAIRLDTLAHEIWLPFNDTLIAEVLKPGDDSKSDDLVTMDSEKQVAAIKDSSLMLPGKEVMDLLNPYMQGIISQKAKALVERLIEFIERKGNCPSVVISGNDRESRSLTITVKDNLAKVTLREHTYHVVSNYIKLIQETFLEWQPLIPFAVVVALAHDLGKIPEMHLGQYNTQEHALISEMVFADIVDQLVREGSETPDWVDRARKAIRDHHMPGVQDQMVVLLKKADRLSRSLELLKFLNDYTIREFEDWFNPKEFIKQLEPLINVVTAEYKWNAVSVSSIVYVKPETVYDIASNMRTSQKVIDSLFVYSDNTQEVLQKVVNALRGCGAVAPIVKENHYARKCKVYTSTSKVSGKAYNLMLVPLRLDVISEVSQVPIAEIERRKTAVLEVINIEPC